jgi:hypothetical protein
MCSNETYCNGRIGKHGLKQGDDLSQFLCNSDLEYAMRKVQKNKEGLN